MTAAFDAIRTILEQSTPEEMITREETLTLIKEFSDLHSLSFLMIGDPIIEDSLNKAVAGCPEEERAAVAAMRSSFIQDISTTSVQPRAAHWINTVIFGELDTIVANTVKLRDSNSWRPGVTLFAADGTSIFADVWWMTLPGACAWATAHCGRTLDQIAVIEEEVFDLLGPDGILPAQWENKPVASFQVHILDDDLDPDERIVKTFTPDDFAEKVPSLSQN